MRIERAPRPFCGLIAAGSLGDRLEPVRVTRLGAEHGKTAETLWSFHGSRMVRYLSGEVGVLDSHEYEVVS